MRYFRLFPDCHLVRGPARAAIYCLTKRKRYHLSKAQSEILDGLAGSSDVESVVANHGEEARRLLATLVKEALGAYFEKPVVSEPYFPKSPMVLRGVFEAPPVIQTLHVQITDACDAGCGFCGDGELLPSQGCNSCLRWTHRGERSAAPEDASVLVEPWRDLDLRKVVVSGGNPLREPNRLFGLAAALRKTKPGIAITVASNGSCLDRELGERLKASAIGLSFSAFGTTPQECGAVTRHPELHSRLLHALATCRELGIAYSITLVAAPTTRETRETLYEWGRSLAGGGELAFTELLPRRDPRVKPRFSGGAPFRRRGGTASSPTGPSKLEDVGLTEYCERRKYNSCLNGRMAIALDGSVLACPVWPTPVARTGPGNGLVTAFRVFARESIVKYWEASKASIPGCHGCENGPACADCAILEWETHREVGERRRFCDYAPELGVWEGGEI